MKAIYVSTVNCILSVVFSQLPIDYNGWNEVTPGLAAANCRQIGAYDPVAEEVKIYGGTNLLRGETTFNPVTENFTSPNPTFLAADIEVDFAWKALPSANIIYYAVSTDGDETVEQLRGITIDGGVEDVFAITSTTEIQRNPGLCINEDNDEVYLVGSKIIQTCQPNAATTPECNTTAQEFLSTEGDNTDLQWQACEVYNNTVYVFGGRNQFSGQAVNTIWRCDPSTADSCEAITDVLPTQIGGITALRINCFNRKYVALIGGILDGVVGGLTSIVNVFNLETETLTGLDALSASRRSVVATFDDVTERIFVYGGVISPFSAGTATCTDAVDVTNSGAMGLCVTDAPTMDPTTEPTNEPTSNPTTAEPSSDPTTMPTSDPTNEPTTAEPTTDPTSEPTTAAPTTSAPTPQSVTPSPTNTPRPTYEPYSPKREENDTPDIAYAVIITILVIICCIIFCCFCWYDKEEREHEYGRMESAQVAVVTAAAGGTVAMAGVVTYCNTCGNVAPCGNACGSTVTYCDTCGDTVPCTNGCSQTQK